MSEAEGSEGTLFPKTAGERLREAREAHGLSLAEVAARTRVPLRQLESIEQGDYASLPSITYAVGFAKAYARAVGVDEVAVAREIRGNAEFAPQRTEYQPYETSDPARTPSAGLAIGAAIVALILVVAAGLYFGTNLFRGGSSSSDTTSSITDTAPDATPSPQPSAAPTPVATGKVTLTATDTIWLRVYDATGKTLYENTMKPGDTYDVPGDANGPMINIGRPDKLQITVNGAAIAPLGDGSHALKDIPISAAALSARAAQAGAALAAAPTPSPSASSTSSGSSPGSGKTHKEKKAAVPPAFAEPQPAAPAPATDSAAVPPASNAAANP
jgi:cytoskeleton protein RodZ